jgi:hypothetical protein
VPDARAIIRISAMPDSSLRKALAGTMEAATRAGKRGAAEEIKAAKQVEREKLRASKSADRAANQAGRAAIKAAQDHQRVVAKAVAEETRTKKQADQAQAREAAKLAKEEVKWSEWAERLKYKAVISTSREAERAAMRQRRESEKTARQQIRDAERAAKAQQTNRRRIATAVGGAVVGAGAAALGRVRSFGSTFGARSPEEMMGDAVTLRRRMVLLADMAGMKDTDRDALQTRVLATSARTGIGAGDIVSGLEKAHGTFTNLQGFAKILDQVANVSLATGTSVENVVGAMGVMRRQFNVTEEDMIKLTGAMVTAADLGSIELPDVAAAFGVALAEMGRNANLHGLPGAIKALAITQTLGAGDVSAADAATLGVHTVTELNNAKVQAGLKAAFGVSVTKSGKIGGDLREMPDIINDLLKHGFMAEGKSALRQEIIPQERGRRGLEMLAKQFRDNPDDTNKLLTAEPETGLESIQRRAAKMTAGVEGQASTLGARQFQTFMEGDSMQQYMSAAVKSSDTLARIEAGHPIMTELVGIGGGALKALAGALLAERVLSGARGLVGAAGPWAATAGAVEGAGAAAAGIGAAGIAAAVAGGVVAGGATYYLFHESAERAGEGIFSALHYEPQSSKTRGIPGAGAAQEPYSDARDSDFVSREPVPWTAVASAPAPLQQSAPEATLKIKIEGPGRVTSVDSSGFDGIETMSMDTGRRDVFPP